jgi:hypothetical protein
MVCESLKQETRDRFECCFRIFLHLFDLVKGMGIKQLSRMGQVVEREWNAAQRSAADISTREYQLFAPLRRESLGSWEPGEVSRQNCALRYARLTDCLSY